MFDFIDAVLEELGKVLQRLIDLILAAFRKSAKGRQRVEDGLIDGQDSVADAMQVFDTIATVIEQDGGLQIVEEIEAASAEIVAKVAEDAPRTIGGQPIDPTVIAREIETIVTATTDELFDGFDAMASSARRAAIVMATGAQGMEEAVEALQKELNTTKARAETAAWTGLAAVERATVVRLAPPDAVFLYEGVRDAKVRPFCDRFVGKAYTREYLNAHNDDPQRKGQPDPVTSYCGGYNCRHSLSALTRDEAEALDIEVVG